MPRVLPVVLAVAVWIYGIIHCALTKSEHMPGRVPKWGWLALNILVPVLGAAVWFVALYMTRKAMWGDKWLFNVGRARPGEGFSSWSDLEKGFPEAGRYRKIGGFPFRRADEDIWVKSAVARVDGKDADGLSGPPAFSASDCVFHKKCLPFSGKRAII